MQLAGGNEAKGPLGLILAGGQGRRMGGADKALVRLGEERLVDRAIRRFGPQVGALAVSANGDPARFGVGLPVLADAVSDFPGPLGGVLAGLDWAAAQGADDLVSVAVDTPFFPCDLVGRLKSAAAPVAVAVAHGRWQGAFALWPVASREPLRDALARGERKVRAVAEALGAVPVVFESSHPDPFFNINTPEDLAEAERMLGEPG